MNLVTDDLISSASEFSFDDEQQPVNADLAVLEAEQLIQAVENTLTHLKKSFGEEQIADWLN